MYIVKEKMEKIVTKYKESQEITGLTKATYH